MGDRAVPRVDLSIGDVHHSQLVVGDHNTIHTPDGTKVTVLQVGERPVPRLRPLPVSRRPSAAEILGREEELDLIAASTAHAPVQLYAPDGAGKTSVLKVAALRASPPIDGVVFESARHCSLDEIQARIYTAFWECDIPFIPAPPEFGEFLADREALLILDDCALDRSELESLLDRVPRCTVVLASQARTLWSRGTARRLADLDPLAAVGLLERELGRSLGTDERRAAETVVARLGGNPQSLVETAALVEDGSTLRELADDPAALERRFDPSSLTDSQKRILEVLSALDGVALGIEHVSAVAAVGETRETMRELERRGWVKAGSPRYRCIRPLTPDFIGSSRLDIANSLLGHLTAWSRKAEPPAVVQEAEAIERVLELGVDTEQWQEALALSLAAERGLMVAGAWSSCRRVLRTGLQAAIAVGDKTARAYVLHQLGSRSLCLGNREEAAEELTEALRIREHLEDEKGAELTRHNLKQLRGGGDGGPDGEGDGGGGPPRMAIVLAVLAVVAGIVGALALAGGDERNVTGTGPGSSSTDPTNPPADAPPEIEIDSPERGAVLEEGAAVTASFSCTAAKGAEIESCAGAVDDVPIDAGAPLDLTPGRHSLRVTAVDDEGRESVDEASYSVEPSPPPVDEEPPDISIVSPAEGKYLQGEIVRSQYSCTDAESSVVTCSGPIASGEAIDTEAVGAHSFTVTATDSAGNEVAKTVEYAVTPAEEEGNDVS